MLNFALVLEGSVSESRVPGFVQNRFTPTKSTKVAKKPIARTSVISLIRGIFLMLTLLNSRISTCSAPGSHVSLFLLLEKNIIREKKPSVVFLENVTNLVHHDKGNTYLTITKSLEEANYSLSPVILDSSLFGVPQSRSRIYIIGLRRDIFGDLKLEYTKKKTERIPLRSILIPGDYSIPISPRWEEYIDLYTGKKNLDEMSFRVAKTRRNLERIAQGCDLNDCVFQVRSSGVRALSLDEPFPTFTVLNSGGGAHIPILSKERRHLSIAEIKRIMGFPDWYDFSEVSRTDAAKQLANAVCPPVITSLCNDIARAIG